jgi:hypothetical protein
MPLTLTISQAYPALGVSQCWRGMSIGSVAEFDVYLRGPVKDRVNDTAFETDFTQDLQALATTQMATDTLESLLNDTDPPLDWEIGEAMAECLLQDELGATWPWNENRDKKMRKASLPGADIVGFYGDGDETIFLFGEVKTSSHADNPPGVMNGRSGLAHQIDTLVTNKKSQFDLLKWLNARCQSTEFRPRYITAAARFLASKGTDFAVVGVLLRDTAAHPDDLRTRGEKFGSGPAQPVVRLDAWYTPRPISEWVSVVSAPAP